MSLRPAARRTHSLPGPGQGVSAGLAGSAGPKRVRERARQPCPVGAPSPGPASGPAHSPPTQSADRRSQATARPIPDRESGSFLRTDGQTDAPIPRQPAMPLPAPGSHAPKWRSRTAGRGPRAGRGGPGAESSGPTRSGREEREQREGRDWAGQRAGSGRQGAESGEGVGDQPRGGTGCCRGETSRVGGREKRGRWARSAGRPRRSPKGRAQLPGGAATPQSGRSTRNPTAAALSAARDRCGEKNPAAPPAGKPGEGGCEHWTPTKAQSSGKRRSAARMWRQREQWQRKFRNKLKPLLLLTQQ